jgi:uncharacterized membrane protein required for colicin V production
MNLVDWVIVVVAVVFAFYGYHQGFLVGILSLAGFVVGAVIGTHVGPELLNQGSQSPYAPLFGLFGALIAGGVLATGLEGVGARLRRHMHLPALSVADGVLGAVLTGAVALGIAWIAGAVVLQASVGSQTLRADVRDSAVLHRLDVILPPSGPLLNALSRVDPLPSLNVPAGPSEVAPPRRGILRAPGVRQAADSVVRIVGTACGLGLEGSGWAAGSHLVVTNAHVVAGEHDTAVQVGGTGAHLDAHTVAFDPHNDIAVLDVPSLDAPALSPHPRAGGTAVAVLGYPENGPFRARPARIGPTRTVTTTDAYGRGPVRRRVVPLRGLVQPGNSGGPLVDRHGHVVATVFAATTGGVHHGGYAVADRTVRRALRHAAAGHTVGTGPCAGG